MRILEKIKRKIMKIFNIQPAREQNFYVYEEMTHETNVLKNRILYRGNASELSQFFGQLCGSCSSRFWGAGIGKIRKIHLSYISAAIDRYTDIVCADLNTLSVDGEKNELWEQIAKENKFNRIIEKAVKETLITGDGAFRLSYDSNISDNPIIDFVPADFVDYTYNRGRLEEVIFYTDIFSSNKRYRLAEIYGHGYIRYELYNDIGKKTELNTLQKTADLHDISFNKKIILAVPFKIFESSIYKNRGKGLFDNKTDEADALDEIASQWLDAIRKGRVKKYIPEILIPRNFETGELDTRGFAFDDDFVLIREQGSEDIQEKIQVVQPDINYEAFIASYVNFLDMLLQGVISPSTLGIDLKKTDNAESQREKEKITCYVRNKIVDAITEAVPDLVSIVLNAHALINNKPLKEYNVSVSFGEYASTDFASVVATVAEAHSRGIMSIEMSIKELYGDTLTEEEKTEEAKRIKLEQGIVEMEQPSIQPGDEAVNE